MSANYSPGLLSIERLRVQPRSVTALSEGEVGLVDIADGRGVAALTPVTELLLKDIEGGVEQYGNLALQLGPLTPGNAAALREYLPWLRPQPLGLRTSAGLGDRLGLATPGHIRAVRACEGVVAPIFAQQSMREMTRTGRTPQQVLDSAMWGVFSEGWANGYGADADHLKTPDDIDRCLQAGYTFYTIDPGEHVGEPDGLYPSALRSAAECLPWAALEDDLESTIARYLSHPVDIESHTVTFDEETVLRCAVKYGGAVAHTTRMYRHLIAHAGGVPVELEISVDETASPTTHAEHVYIARELHRLGVRWVSLAPRYIGTFEKGVDYIGNLEAFEADFAVHAAIARSMGPYKLSLHSGSDKFSIYEPAARLTGGLVHLKTAGTSYLEALRTIAEADPELFLDIYVFAREHYEADRASYQVSARLDRAPLPEDLTDRTGSELLNHFDAREILHVTFGSVLTGRTPSGHLRFGDRLQSVLTAEAELYASNLQAHFLRHLMPFRAATARPEPVREAR